MSINTKQSASLSVFLIVHVLVGVYAFVCVVLLLHAYCVEQCVVNSVYELGVHSWVVYGVKWSIRLSLGKEGGGREGNEEERWEKKGEKQQEKMLSHR